MDNLSLLGILLSFRNIEKTEEEMKELTQKEMSVPGTTEKEAKKRASKALRQKHKKSMILGTIIMILAIFFCVYLCIDKEEMPQKDEISQYQQTEIQPETGRISGSFSGRVGAQRGDFISG